MQQLTIVKVGGAVVEDTVQLAHLLTRFQNIKGHKVLVHGGGRRATKVASALGIESQMVNGRRITDAAMLEVVTMVYGGLVNKNIVALLQARGINALGLTGADMNIILSHKRPPVSLMVNSPLNSHDQASNVGKCTTKATGADSQEEKNSAHYTPQVVDFGFVGDVDRANGQALKTLIEAGITPVVAPLTHDGKGQLLNTNADTMAAETAKALAPYYDVTLIYSFEKKGVLRCPDDDNSVIPTITRTDFEQLKANGTIAGGMIPKIENALNAVEQGVKKVIITQADTIDSCLGTTIKS